ncbi:hypothetical protein C8F04DRAFT_710761 [Mycena alexandri]|uniref:Secreted protein n=1 Tax=Mycena alexandri TaxID=1745969 RepID=A0AAD6SNX5_9AGAR|nr:hypothetical protein C8F04DRAFT_710761 [Mycena alexandri]
MVNILVHLLVAKLGMLLQDVLGKPFYRHRDSRKYYSSLIAHCLQNTFSPCIFRRPFLDAMSTIITPSVLNSCATGSVEPLLATVPNRREKSLSIPCKRGMANGSWISRVPR